MRLVKAVSMLGLVMIAMVAAGCGASASGDKAGGLTGPAGGPVVLPMASAAFQPPPEVADFIRRVRTLSRGSIQIKVINNWGDYAPSNEAQVVHAVAAGHVMLGYAGSAVFDTIGVPDFRALSAPMLIDNYPLENSVLKSTAPARMLAGLSRAHVTGLAVLGDGLRHPIAVHRALLAPADWRGLSIGTYGSGIQEQAIRALGATPVVAVGPYRLHDLATGAIQGFELDMQRYVVNVPTRSARYVTENVALWPLFEVLLANQARFASLTAQQRGWLRQAAQQAATDSVSLIAGQNGFYVRRACSRGARFASATPGDLVALREAFAPAYSNLETDPQTRAFITEFQQLKNATPPGPTPGIPAGCSA